MDMIEVNAENHVTFNINIHKNSLLVKGDIPDDFETFEVLGKFIEAIGKLNKELEIVLLFDMKKVPFMFIMYLNKIQKTLLREENGQIEMQFTIVSRDKDLKEFLEGFRDSTNLMASQGMNPFKDIMDTMGAGTNNLDEVIIPDGIKENMPEDIQKNIDKINGITPESLQDLSNKGPNSEEELDDLNIEELNKIKFIYQE